MELQKQNLSRKINSKYKVGITLISQTYSNIPTLIRQIQMKGKCQLDTMNWIVQMVYAMGVSTDILHAVFS